MSVDDTTSGHPLDPTREHAGLAGGAMSAAAPGRVRPPRWLLVTVAGVIALVIAVVVVLAFGDGEEADDSGPSTSPSTSSTSTSSSTTTTTTTLATPTTSISPPIQLTVPTLLDRVP